MMTNMLDNETEVDIDYQRIAQAITFLQENYQTQPSLDELAAELHLSPFHLQRLFTRWAGVSPKRFVQHLTLKHAHEMLNRSQSMLDTTYELGLSSPSRLHDLFVKLDAVTPAEYKKMGAGLVIRYGFHFTPFGEALVALTQRGICGLHFVAPYGRAWTIDALATAWPNATLIEDAAETAPVALRIFEAHAADDLANIKPFHIFVKGTNFQIKVWEALLRIPDGAAATYGQIAETIGNKNASRAVGSAVGTNHVAYLIPCHRVIRKSGKIDAYRWGSDRKRALLAWEGARFPV